MYNLGLIKFFYIRLPLVFEASTHTRLLPLKAVVSTIHANILEVSFLKVQPSPSSLLI
jgi:hypothetical protein